MTLLILIILVLFVIFCVLLLVKCLFPSLERRLRKR